MKKISFILVLVMIFQLLLVSCGPIVSGNQGNNTQDGNTNDDSAKQEQETHEHSFSDELTYDKSYHFYACECGESIGSQYHEYGEWLTVKEATETEDGQKIRECIECDYIQIVSIPGGSHIHATESTDHDETKHWQNCSCGMIISLEPHSFSDWKVTTAATESATGMKMRECTECEYDEFLTIPKIQKGETVFEWTKIAIQNVGTSQYMNYDYGELANGTKLRVWPWDGSNEQLFSIDNISSNTYRILTYSSANFAVDVYRNGKALAAGQLCDIWKAGNDATAQNIKLHLCSDGSYILRMANNMDLAIAATASKEQLSLVKFNESDNKQKWRFKDSTGADINIKDNMPSSIGITEEYYKLTGESFIVAGTTYYGALTTKEYNGVSADEMFYLNKNNSVVTNAETLSKISTLVTMNKARKTLYNIAVDNSSNAREYYEAYVNIGAMNKLGEVIGAGSGTLLKLGMGDPFSLGDAAVEIAKNASGDEIKKAVFIGLVKLYTNNCEAYAKKFISLASSDYTSYEDMMEAMDNYAKMQASMDVILHIAGDDVRELSGKTTWDLLKDYFNNVFKSMANSLIPDIDALKIAGYLSSGAAALNDFYIVTGVKDVYESKVNIWNNKLSTINENGKIVADKLAVSKGVSATKYVAAGLVEKVDALMKKYPEGTNVSHSYTFPSTSAWECHGFACYALMSFWGTKKPGVKNTAEYKTYHATTTESYVDKIRPGDLVRFRYDGYDHTIVVTNVDDDNIYYADCNSDLKCTFRYNKVMSKATLASYLVKKLGSQEVSVRGYILHYKNNDL